jgi:SAM-dependent methyltransferase
MFNDMAYQKKMEYDRVKEPISVTPNLGSRTISDFSDQWKRYNDNEGWYGSLELFKGIIEPLLGLEQLKGASVAEIGCGTGRIVSILLDADVDHVIALEPSGEAFLVLEQNIHRMKRCLEVTAINANGESWRTDRKLDYVFSIGVIHHIPEPDQVIQAAYEALKPGGCLFLWLYGYEGNEAYLRVIGPLRKITTKLPHLFLRVLVELLYGLLCVYWGIQKVIPLPLSVYLEKVLWPMTPNKRRLVIYDQLNPAYAKYYKKEEAVQLLKKAGFQAIQIHHRYGYSWSVIGQKPHDEYLP